MGTINDVIALVKSREGKNQYVDPDSPDSYLRDKVFEGYSDCSSLMWKCFERGMGINIGTYTKAQIDNGRNILTNTDVSIHSVTQSMVNRMQPGDLVFWGTGTNSPKHVEMYVGSNTLYGHGKGMGPTAKNIFSYTHKYPVIQVRRYTSDNSTGKNYLEKGDNGEAVKTMQIMLIACGYSCGSAGADGSFGDGTFAALVAFQKANGLEPDGFYGEKTKAKLEEKYNEKNKEIVIKQGANGMWVRADGSNLNVRNVPNGPTIVAKLADGTQIKCDRRKWVNGTCYFRVVDKGWVDGHYLEGWVGEDNKWWYLNPNFTYTKSDWQKILNAWYFFDKYGWMMHDTWLDWKGKRYYLKSWGGCCINETYTINGVAYRFDSNGALIS